MKQILESARIGIFMIYTKQEILNFLENHNIPFQLYKHEPLFTSEQAITIVARMNMPGMGIKNLFLKDSKKNFYLISAAYTTQIDIKITGKTIGAKELRFADTDALMQHLHVKPGSVTPIALINNSENSVQMILDSNIFNYELIQIHPLENDASIVLKPTNLLKFFAAINRTFKLYNFTEHRWERI